MRNFKGLVNAVFTKCARARVFGENSSGGDSPFIVLCFHNSVVLVRICTNRIDGKSNLYKGEIFCKRLYLYTFI